MNVRIELGMLFVMAMLISGNMAQAQNSSLHSSTEGVSKFVDLKLLSDKMILMDAGTKQISVWTLSDYNANPKDYTLKIISAPSAGKVLIAKDGVSIIYTPTAEVINDKVSVEVCHVSGRCDQASISFVQNANQDTRSINFGQ